MTSLANGPVTMIVSILLSIAFFSSSLEDVRHVF